jgi:nucleoside-diphosphate-sugar epimerase
MDYRRILITGGTGFLAYAFYQYLRRTDSTLDVWVFSRRTGGDVRDFDAIRKAVEGKDIVYHLAAQSHVDFSINGTVEEKQAFISTNVAGTLNVLLAARQAGVKLVHISTSEVYGTSQTPGVPMTEEHPLAPDAGVYAASKCAADHLCRVAYMTEGDPVVVVRPFNLFGPHQSSEKLIPRFLRLASFGEPLTIYGDGTQRRDYLYSPDAAEALWLLRFAPAGTIVNIGTENSWTINEVADMILRHCGDRGMAVHADMTKARPNEVRELNGSYAHLHNMTGWRPRTLLPAGIGKVCDWMLANGAITPPKILGHG